MKTIYVDNIEYKCHVTDDGTMIPVETDFFDGKCDAFIEGHRCVPNGCEWKRSDGVAFEGRMITPWEDSRILAAYQRQYEVNAAQIAEMEEALNIYLTGGST